MRTLGIDLSVKAAHRAVVMAEDGGYVSPVIFFHASWAEIEELVARAREDVERAHIADGPGDRLLERAAPRWMYAR